MFVKFPSKLAWLPIIALSNVAFFMIALVCTKLFLICAFSTREPFPKETFGPTVAFIKTTSSPIKHGGIMVAFSILTF